MHWRDAHAAVDWPSLQAQVRRWQAVALLDWPDADILAVSRYLNDRIYRFEPVTAEAARPRRQGF